MVGHVGRRGKERTLFEPRRTISMQQKCWFQSEIERDRDRVRVRSKRCHNTRYQLRRVFGTPVTTKKLLMELEIFVLSPAPLFFSPPNNERPTWPNTSMCVCVCVSESFAHTIPFPANFTTRLKTPAKVLPPSPCPPRKCFRKSWLPHAGCTQW